MRNRLEGEPMDILRLGGGGATSCWMTALDPWVQASGVVQRPRRAGNMWVSAHQTLLSSRGLESRMFPRCVKLLFRTELPELHLVIAHALQDS